MPSHNNQIVIAAAGSRKTTQLVEEAIASAPHRVLVTTFTTENLDELRQAFVRRCGLVPAHVTLQSWYSFLLRDCVRPYQRSVIPAVRIDSMLFADLPRWAQRSSRAQPQRHYLAGKGRIFRDRISEFAYHANEASENAVVRRLERLYGAVFIDELQDMSGYDFELLHLLLHSSCRVMCVADPRQTTLSTSHTTKNKQYRGNGILRWAAERTRASRVDIVNRNESFRCNQTICDFADRLFPDLPATVSREDGPTGHDGIFYIRESEVPGYIEAHKPIVLQHNKNAKQFVARAFNFGAVKGRTYDHVLIVPTKPILQYLASRNNAGLKDPCRLYVAVTRARYSVAFVVD